MFDIPTVLVRLAARHSKSFVFRDETLPLERVFAIDGALPILVKRANLLADFLFGRKMSVALVNDPETLTGERVNIMAEQSLFEFVMLLHDVVEEYVVTTSGNVINLN
ncbi:MAG: hypothetical protein NTV32_04150 [Gammaproteobacteria bacterium]|jgi:hypothetical protein|nr:hypothetical protein [Gammaproteobacteria bacterium]